MRRRSGKDGGGSPSGGRGRNCLSARDQEGVARQTRAPQLPESVHPECPASCGERQSRVDRNGRGPLIPPRQQGELRTATVASATLAAAQWVQTRRRNEAKPTQKKDVKQFLHDMRFAEVGRRPISILRDAPDPGHFSPECKLGVRRAGMVVGLYDHRVPAVECKASNGEVNSFKRINHEAVCKARSWIAAFGRNQLVPATILTGVFNPNNLDIAQSEGLAQFRIHGLDDLQEFINATGK